jgi:nitrate reductase (NAD(P)H)
MSAVNTNLVPETPMTKPDVDRKITLEELEAQPKDAPWFVVRGEVYDGTGFLKEHPGGADSILLVAGEDASEDFINIHSADGRAKLAQVCCPLIIGVVFTQ